MFRSETARGLMLLAAVLLVIWIAGLLVYKVASFLFHVVLVLALVALVGSFFAGRRRV